MQKEATQDIKDFYTSDNFFQIIVTNFALALCMQETLCSEILKFQIWLSENNCSKIVQDVENKSLGLFKTIELQASTIENVKVRIIANIICEK